IVTGSPPCSLRTGAGTENPFFDLAGAAAGASALAAAGGSIAAHANKTAIAILLSAGFREQPNSPLAGEKIRVNFADKIHRSRDQRHVIGRHFRNHSLDRADRIALDASGTVRREMRHQFLRFERAFGLGPRQGDVAHARTEHGGHRAPFLGGLAAEDQARFHARTELDAHRLQQCRDTHLVVRAIEDNQRPLRYDVKAPRPAYFPDAAPDGVLVYSPALRPQSLERRHRDRGVLMLKWTCESNLEIADF